ncbi:MAG: TrkH family potassium uptake protein [Trueperaceae bacterium]
MREREHLRRRYAAIAAAAGAILLLAAALMLTPLLALVARPDEVGHAWAFVAPAACLAALGLVLRRAFPYPADVTLTVQEGGVIVVACWVVVIAFSAWPFVAVTGLPLAHALFESVSGWTTTGLSLVDVAEADRVILLWRSVTQLAGGAGLAILMLSAIVGPAGVGISSAEGRSDQLLPQVRRSARLVLGIYAAYAAVGTVAYVLAGMTAFDAVNHAFTAVSTGGFSTRPESIGYWDSWAVEAVTLPLMVLGSLSFLTAWSLFRGQLRAATRSSELRLAAIVLPIATAAVFLLTTRALYPRLGDALRVATFETVSALTTTGFTTVTYGAWNGFGLLALVMLMMIGGGTCSTAGGMKQARVFLLWKLVQWEIARHLMPRTAVLERSVWEANRRAFVDDDQVRRLVTFVVLYLSAYAAGVLVLTGSGFGFEASAFEFASAIGTVGLSVGVTGTQMPDGALWAVMGAMFLGRLEFVVVIVSVVKLVADGRAMIGGRWPGGRRGRD